MTEEAYCFIDQFGTIIEKNDAFDHLLKGPNGKISDSNIVNYLNFKDLSWESKMKYTHFLSAIFNSKSVNRYENDPHIKMLLLSDKAGKVHFLLSDYVEGKGILGKLEYEEKENKFVSSISDENKINDKLKLLTKKSISEIKVGVIDDSVTSGKMVQHVFKNLNIRCDFFASPEQVNDVYDVLFVDIFMPGTDGLDFCASLRKGKHVAPHFLIIAISGDMNTTLITEVVQAGFDAFISKPITAAKIQSLDFL